MRHFYIFNINKEFIILTKKHPYSLFKTFEEIYNLNKDQIKYGISIYDNVIIPFDKYKLSNIICNYYKLNDNYIKFNNIHTYNDYYNRENSKLTINNSFMILDSTSVKPVFVAKEDSLNRCN